MRVPHLAQYQGSKRSLAPRILEYMPPAFNRLIEPFSGTASVSIAAAFNRKTSKFHINDINGPLIGLLKEAIEHPQRLIGNYKKIWNDQFNYQPGHVEHYYYAREIFNKGETAPEIMLYLMARCIKGAIRYGGNGNFNQSPDKRRHGAQPEKMAMNILSISHLLKGKTTYSSTDYRDIFNLAQPGDMVYMDPSYQGVCQKRDSRYVAGISFTEFCESIKILNRKQIDYIISYDGECGDKTYGKELPGELMCKKIRLNAGLSTQQTLLGKRQTTYESLYISKSLSLLT